MTEWLDNGQKHVYAHI